MPQKSTATFTSCHSTRLLAPGKNVVYNGVLPSPSCFVCKLYKPPAHTSPLLPACREPSITFTIEYCCDLFPWLGMILRHTLASQTPQNQYNAGFRPRTILLCAAASDHLLCRIRFEAEALLPEHYFHLDLRIYWHYLCLLCDRGSVTSMTRPL